MKNLFFILFFSLAGSMATFGQATLWGVTFEGGIDNGGILYKNNLSGDSFELMHSFNRVAGEKPQITTLCETPDGSLFGLTSIGGSLGGGVLFEYDVNRQSYDLKFEFDLASGGSVPMGSPMVSSNGKIYGYTYIGGTDNVGTIFEYNPDTEQLTFVYNFLASICYSPFGKLIEASDGFFYGMARQGGANNHGVIFKYNPNDGFFSIIHDFDGTHGSGPIGSLLEAGNDKLYGTTTTGGPSNFGTLFEYNLSTSTFVMILGFNGNNGKLPYAELIQASNGKLYGATAYGGTNDKGVIFEYDYITNAYSVLFEADNAYGILPTGPLYEASTNKIYGLCREGGANNAGGIYSFDIAASTYNLEHSFNTTDGEFPMGGLMRHSNGKLYGLTLEGGSQDMGTCFSYNDQTITLEKEFDFGAFSFGSQPIGSLYASEDKMIYGVTYTGGTGGGGILYSYEISSGQFSKLMDFDLNTGGLPASGFTEVNGILYGTTLYGGSNNLGVLYSFNPQTYSYEVIYNFNIGVGAMPFSAVTFNGDDKLFGLTYAGGLNGLGVLYEYDLLNTNYTVLVNFDGIDKGDTPINGLMLADENTLYGHTQTGGINDKGVIFKYDLVSSTFTKIFDFGGNNGENPFGNFVMGPNNKLYGTTMSGGTGGFGVLFEVNPQNDNFIKIKDFNGTNGAVSSNSLMLASNDLIYGMTEEGGACNSGVVFTYNTGSNSYDVIFDFDAGPGKKPEYTALLECCLLPEITSQPSDVEAEAGDNVVFSVIATGDVQEYKWYHNNAEISSSNTASLTIENIDESHTGEYKCEVIGSCGSVFSEIAVLTLSDGLEEFTDTDYQIYPNPFNEILIISSNSNKSDHAVTIYNIAGQIVFRELYSTDRECTINTEAFSPGIYLLQIRAEKCLVNHKIVKR